MNYNYLNKKAKSFGYDDFKLFIEDYNFSRVYDDIKMANRTKATKVMYSKFDTLFEEPFLTKLNKEYKQTNIVEFLKNIKFLPKIPNYIPIVNGLCNKEIISAISKKPVNIITLQITSYSITDPYFAEQIKNMNKFQIEVYQADKLLDDYYTKLNAKRDHIIYDGDIKQSIEKFYDEYFPKQTKSSIVEEYLMGLIWVCEYYFNKTLYTDWYYPIKTSPLIQDIYAILLKDSEILNRLSKRLSDNHTTEQFMTSTEQLLFITPFDLKKLKSKVYDENLYIFNKLIPSHYIEKLINVIITTPENYLDMSLNEKLLDCRGAGFLSKCTIKNISYDAWNIVKKVREIYPREEQNKIKYNSVDTPDPDLVKYIKKYKHYKNTYLINRSINDKAKYKFYKEKIKYFI
jgi:hypothetical protein